MKKKEDLSILRENFLKAYCKKRGWNESELKTRQMMEIINQPEYKNPKVPG
jgi:hypothetical protein